eukprot:11964338-Alexandrium_andersonii.AAC.1
MPPAQDLWNRCPHPGHCSTPVAAGPPVLLRRTLQTCGSAPPPRSRWSTMTHSGPQEGSW